MKIMFVWRKYDGIVGGVERMSVALMNEMVRRGHEVELLSWDRARVHSYYDMDPRINWHKLDLGDSDKKAGSKLRLQRILKIRRIFRNSRPDVAIAFMDGVFLSVKLSILGLHIPVVEAERCSPARFRYLKSARYTGLIFQGLRLARNITIQIESYRQYYPVWLRGRIVTIPNPVFPAECRARPGEGQQNTLLSVGRLSYQKNYAVLIRAFAAIAAEFPDWTLKIIGDGEEKEALQKLVGDLELTQRIELKGTIKNIAAEYCAAHLFCLPSRWEGFPNALAEALAHGLPAVGFAGCLGVCDLIQDRKNGVLASGNDNIASLAEALRILMKDSAARARMGQAAIESMQPYKPQNIFDQWEDFFKQASS